MSQDEPTRPVRLARLRAADRLRESPPPVDEPQLTRAIDDETEPYPKRELELLIREP